MPPTARRASERNSASPPSPSDARAVGCLVCWLDFRSGRVRSQAQFPKQPRHNGSAACLRKERSVCGGLPSIKPAVCKVTPAVVGVIWRAAIWVLAQAGERARKTRHQCAAMRPGAQARPQACGRLSPHRSTALSVLAPCGASALASQRARWPDGQGVGLWSRRSQFRVLGGSLLLRGLSFSPQARRGK